MTDKEKYEFKYNTVEESYRSWTEKTEVHEVSSYRTKNERKRALIRQLKEQGYDELKVHNESDLTENLRQQFQRLIDRKELYENQLQILDFQTQNTEALIILINGIPVVCIELWPQTERLRSYVSRE